MKNVVEFFTAGFVFFVGFDTTKSLLQMTAYELAMNSEVQVELVDEIDKVLAQLDGKPVTYELLHRMKFLDQVMSESLRFHPPQKFLNRECNKNCKLNLGSGKLVEIKRGENILIPVESIQKDEKFFENAMKFDPHRFDAGKRGSIISGSFIPFGIGPRACIGSRFALMIAKLIMFTILSKFTIEVCDETPKQLKFVPSLFTFEYESKVFLELKPRK